MQHYFKGSSLTFLCVCEGPDIYLRVFLCAQMRGGAVHGACQSEAAVHPDSEPRQRGSGFPTCSEHMQRGNHHRPLRRAARPASGTTEPAGQLCQYPYHSRKSVCISSV